MRLFSASNPVATAAINLRPRTGSWGGANQWVSQLTRWLEFNGWRVVFDVKGAPDIVLMTHTGLAAQTTFGAVEVRELKNRHPDIRCVHRINDNDIRKETTEMDMFLARSSEVADHTVFVSEWLRDYHAGKWFDAARPHSVILPGADSRFFHPIGGAVYDPAAPLTLVTHHWSDNWNKGFDVYRDIDELIASSKARKFELRVIGRWPADLKWKSARTFAPASGARLAGMLRECHGYVSASRFEPGAMHVAEGLQCGLPLLYHRDSGGTVGQGKLYGHELGDDLEESLDRFAAGLPTLRARLLADPPSGSKMSAAYLNLLQRLVVHG